MIVIKLPATPDNCRNCSILGARVDDAQTGIVGYRVGEFLYILDLGATAAAAHVNDQQPTAPGS